MFMKWSVADSAEYAYYSRPTLCSIGNQFEKLIDNAEDGCVLRLVNQLQM